jgi:GAF domain-containing protein
LCRAFEQCTGWGLCYLDGPALTGSSDALWVAPVESSGGRPRGHFRLTPLPGSAAEPCSDLHDAAELASQLARLVSAYQAVAETLEVREAELASGAALVSPVGKPRQLLKRLKAALRGGARAARCQAAALYLLDERTRELLLRCQWNLPVTRLADAPRPLSEAAADLEALAGCAVVLENAADFPELPMPQPFAAGVCVPVSSSREIYGTMWLFSDRPRRFSARQTGMAEIVAGRLAVELELAAVVATQNTPSR